MFHKSWKTRLKIKIKNYTIECYMGHNDMKQRVFRLIKQNRVNAEIKKTVYLFNLIK